MNSQLPYWRPRIYSTTNPGGVGHLWYYHAFIIPFERRTESATRFIPARVDDNKFTNPEYKEVLASRTGWQKKAWYDGSWDIAAGQFFNTFRRDIHVLDHFDDRHALEWFASLDYGFSHYTVALLGCLDAEGNLIVVDEHAERLWIPQRHVLAIKAMLQRHQVFPRREIDPERASRPSGNPDAPLFAHPSGELVGPLDPRARPFLHPERHSLSWFVAGGDVFSTQYDGSTLASQFGALGVSLRRANTDRALGWAEIHRRLGDPDAGIKPSLLIHQRCRRLLDCLPFLQTDPDQPADILKTNTNEEGLGGDDAADALRYMVAYRPRTIYATKLRGL
jgi:hypothetical protein